MATEVSNEHPAEVMAKAVEASEGDLMRAMDSMGRPELKDELRDWLREFAKGLREGAANGR
jgi:hypothetical protein